MNRRVLFIALSTLMAGSAFAPTVTFAAPPGATDLQMETASDVRDVAYQDPAKIAKSLAPNGAYSPENIEWDQTHSGKWYIEEQRVGTDAIMAGLADNDDAAIDRGLKILEWGFAQENQDGTFPTTAGGQDWNIFHSESFFVEASSHAILLLEASPKAKHYQDRLDRMKPLLLRATQWMTLPDVEADGKAHNYPYTHRRYLVADALGETGLACNSDGLIRKSVEYVKNGLSLQSPDGYNPEKGGPDTSYNAGGLVFAERYYVTVLPRAEEILGDTTLQNSLANMVRRDAAWEASQISPDGLVSTANNTRVKSSGERDRGGKTKKVDVKEIYRCLFYADFIAGDSKYESLGTAVATNRQ